MENKKEKEKKGRKKSIHIRLNDDIFNELQDLKINLKAETWEDLIKLILKNKSKVKKVYVDENGYSEKFLTELKMQGNNLNQIAKVANSTNQLSDENYKKMLSSYRSNLKLRNDFLKNTIIKTIARRS